eukprot:TRINITY_DN9448_c0_g1_i1.p1 TRINITY_DN9448_c0_g1~~TRINITY_DN9448_c0_g1_i1.p1  ORF type:complete len:698 (+),score=261.76 TRINITY_DN9448_c0_g1_i1:69-2096(+)
MGEDDGHLSHLIPVMNRLQDVFSTANLTTKMDLPQIAVVGSQSSGKSSVLENIVGRDFLPRGSGIVTRRPLLLQLIRVSKARAEKRRAEGKPVEWAEFLHSQGREFTDFAQVRAEIQAETDKLCGPTKNVRAEEIRLSIHSPSVVDLTLIDLPGLTKVAVEGQAEDVMHQIEQCVLQWIRPSKTIILAVSAANQDIANSDALKIAKRVDPEGNRTVGVLTKLDLMDRGTDAAQVLAGRVVRLKKGFIGIVNRSQADIDARVPIEESLKKEERFFRDHPAYTKVADSQGTGYLVNLLNKTLLLHIKDALPILKSKIQDLLDQTEKMLESFGDVGESQSPDSKLLHLLAEYAKSVEQSLEGSAPEVMRSSELVGGARINHLFNFGFVPFLKRLDPLQDITDEQIRATVHNCQGTRNILFIPEQAFEILVKSRIGNLETPAQKCIDYVFEELLKICERSEEKLSRFPTLKQRTNDFIGQLMMRYKRPCCQYVTDMIRTEQAYINTNHPDFYGGGQLDQLVKSWTELRQEQAHEAQAEGGPPGLTARPSGLGAQPAPRMAAMDFNSSAPTVRYDGHVDDKQRRENEVIRHLVGAYYAIVRKNVQDHVPKAVMCFMVNKLRAELRNELVQEFYKPHLVQDLLHESVDNVRKRKAAESMRKALQEALATLNTIREFRLRDP